ncbi:DUF4232 domain-containing protein [Streptomyces varsoviensis]|uniref:DUF4232 domain-containing protein n=1 Tax=Streptomyces varsoviensis TaxID=67373 RepID=UPI0034024708
MRTSPFALHAAAAVTGVLLLTACGSQQAGSDALSEGGSARAEGKAGGKGTSSLPGAFSCVPRTRPGASAAPTPPVLSGDPAKLEKDGVKITNLGGDTRACADFTVANHGAQALTYTIAFTFMSDEGRALTNTVSVVPAVKPGQTVRRVVTADGLPPDARAEARVAITKVRTVPAAEAPAKDGACPPSGTRVYADDGDAAMGLRAVSIHLENCGSEVTQLNGYPKLQLLDAAHKPAEGVRVLHGGSAISTGTGADGAPRPIALKPGERAYAVMVWRNTVENGEPVNAPYVRVRAKEGAAPVIVTPELDLGTTGKLGIGPWKKDETPRSPGGSPDRPRP